MNILFLTHVYPYPPDDGGKIASFNPIKEEFKLGNRIIMVTFHHQKIAKNELDEYADVHFIYKKTSNSFMGAVINFFQKLPYNMVKYYDIRVISKIDEILS